jgi:predicted DsbA family dithiol-disulfide isomerase
MTIRHSLRWTFGRFLSRAAAHVILLGIGGVSVVALQTAPAQSAADDQGTVGVIGQERLTESGLIKTDEAGFDRLRSDYETEQHQLEFKYAKARYDLLKRRLDDRLDAAALDLEAKARGVATETVLAELKTSPPTEEETRAFYAQNKDRIHEPYEQIAPKVREYLTSQRSEAAKRTFYDALRAKHGIKSLLGPYRVAVAATGPVRGPASAPVTIVEFGDFQCPYCKRVESSLHAVLEQYPRKVRVVFRNLPLTQIHSYAGGAAEAAVCADRQGKFWEMHDAMYADQSALTAEGLKDTAKRLGLDLGKFSSCLAGHAPAAVLDADVKAAQALGLSGTPYFFINGRPLDGNVPLEKFQSIIAEELRASGSDRG